jgi:hypothetical protein
MCLNLRRCACFTAGAVNGDLALQSFDLPVLFSA